MIASGVGNNLLLAKVIFMDLCERSTLINWGKSGIGVEFKPLFKFKPRSISCALSWFKSIFSYLIHNRLKFRRYWVKNRVNKSNKYLIIVFLYNICNPLGPVIKVRMFNYLVELFVKI